MRKMRTASGVARKWPRSRTPERAPRPRLWHDPKSVEGPETWIYSCILTLKMVFPNGENEKKYVFFRTRGGPWGSVRVRGDPRPLEISVFNIFRHKLIYLH